jgi:phospholipase/carboxylesterase/glyoxalase family protein
MKPPDDLYPGKPEASLPAAPDLGFVHIFVPAEKPKSPTLLMLHGTGGDERDLLPLGRELWPGAALLGVRGKVLENGMPRFFRRFAEGVFDVEDLKSRTQELAQFVDAASERYEFSRKKLIVVGYSNGANIAASLILLHPHYLGAAILFRAMVPFVPDLIRDFSHLAVFIGAGRLDPIVPSGQVEELGALFESGGADVTISWRQGGHELGEDDVRAAKTWLSKDKVRKTVAA